MDYIILHAINIHKLLVYHTLPSCKGITNQLIAFIVHPSVFLLQMAGRRQISILSLDDSPLININLWDTWDATDQGKKEKEKEAAEPQEDKGEGEKPENPEKAEKKEKKEQPFRVEMAHIGLIQWIN